MPDPITIEDIYKLFQASQQEADRRAAEADRRLAESERLTDEVKQQMAKLEKIAAQTSREVANLTTRWGRFVENLVEPAVASLFREREIEVYYTSNRVKCDKPGLVMEIDILVENTQEVVLIEVKSRLAQDDVDAFIAKLRKFRQAFPKYAQYQVYGAVAGIEILQGVDAYAYRRGIFVIKQAGESAVIANDANFQPANW